MATFYDILMYIAFILMGLSGFVWIAFIVLLILRLLKKVGTKAVTVVGVVALVIGVGSPLMCCGSAMFKSQLPEVQEERAREEQQKKLELEKEESEKLKTTKRDELETPPPKKNEWEGREDEAIYITQTYAFTDDEGSSYTINDLISISTSLMQLGFGVEDIQVLGWSANYSPSFSPSSYTVKHGLKRKSTGEITFYIFTTDIKTKDVKPQNDHAKGIWEAQ